jgi:hypothetical protein
VTFHNFETLLKYWNFLNPWMGGADSSQYKNAMWLLKKKIPCTWEVFGMCVSVEVGGWQRIPHEYMFVQQTYTPRLSAGHKIE